MPPPLVGFLVSLVFLIFKIPIPDFATSTLTYIGNIVTPLSLIYIGITAIVRLIIVQHDNPYSVLIWSGAILLLVISLAIAEKFIKKN